MIPYLTGAIFIAVPARVAARRATSADQLVVRRRGRRRQGADHRQAAGRKVGELRGHHGTQTAVDAVPQNRIAHRLVHHESDTSRLGRSGSACNSRWTTTARRPARRPDRTARRKSSDRRSRFDAGSTRWSPSGTVSPTAQAARRWRPLPRREARMARPARVRIRRRKPCFLCRRRLFGWNVRLLTGMTPVRTRDHIVDKSTDRSAAGAGPAHRIEPVTSDKVPQERSTKRPAQHRPIHGTRLPVDRSNQSSPYVFHRPVDETPPKRHVRGLSHDGAEMAT